MPTATLAAFPGSDTPSLPSRASGSEVGGTGTGKTTRKKRERVDGVECRVRVGTAGARERGELEMGVGGCL